MEYKRILTIQDISCIGQCSTTVAMPILSACGHETCILPTAILSTHTGGFGKPHVIHLKDQLRGFISHWKENQICFDAILTGYLGSVEAIDLVSEVADELLAEDGVLIVDPAMADHGKLYSGLSKEYAAQMISLCKKAHIIMPNITEAAMYTGLEYCQQPNPSYINQLLLAMNHPCVILTGVGYEKGTTGVVLFKEGLQYHYTHKRIEQRYHGTGDMFAACFTGALLHGNNHMNAIALAADFVLKSIESTSEKPAHWYGVKFEAALPYLIQQLSGSDIT